VSGTNWFPDWGQSTVVSDVSLGGNAAKKLSNLNYQGVQLAAPLDVSAMSTVHIDVWAPAAGTFKLKAINSAAVTGTGSPAEKTATLTTVAGWNSFDVALSEFSGVNPAKIDQLAFEGTGTVYFDNLYFYKAASSPVL
jgi:hypothetical protein